MSPLSGVLNEAWALYKRFFSHFILISFVIYLAIAIVTALLTLAAGGWGSFIGWLLSLFGVFLLQAALVKAVQDVRDGRADLDLKETLSAALPFVGAVAIASILASIGIAIGFVLIIVPGLILLTFWSLIVPWIVLGGAEAMESFGRSWRTVRGYAWNVFGTYVLTFLILIAAEIVLSLILIALSDAWRNFISNVVSGTLVAPFIAAVVTLVYYRLTAAHGEQAEAGAPSAAGAASAAGAWSPTGAPSEPGAPGAPSQQGTAPGAPSEPNAPGAPSEPGTAPGGGFGQYDGGPGQGAPGAPSQPGTAPGAPSEPGAPDAPGTAPGGGTGPYDGGPSRPA
jgi:hypothetical protein